MSVFYGFQMPGKVVYRSAGRPRIIGLAIDNYTFTLFIFPNVVGAGTHLNVSERYTSCCICE